MIVLMESVPTFLLVAFVTRDGAENFEKFMKTFFTVKTSFFLKTQFQGWTGEKCDRPVCTDSCQNGGILDDMSCTCFCPEGYSGDLCENDPCSSQPCVNGQCSVNGPSYECTCADNWTGLHCDIFVAPGPCESDPCIQGKILPQF